LASEALRANPYPLPEEIQTVGCRVLMKMSEHLTTGQRDALHRSIAEGSYRSFVSEKHFDVPVPTVRGIVSFSCPHGSARMRWEKS
jgi:hypothetical protein